MAINDKRSLLSSCARVQVPWIKVTIGDYTFGVFSKNESRGHDSETRTYFTQYNVQYPNFVQRLEITKLNGQINQYTLALSYPVTQTDDPNFFEKVFSSVSRTRKIVFSYGDMSMPSFIYKDEEAMITKVSSRFNLQGGVIDYTVNAVSTANLAKTGNWTFQGGLKKPSSEIFRILFNRKYGLLDVFTGMTKSNAQYLIASDDKEVMLDAKQNISALDYITYLVSCMLPLGTTTKDNANSDVYVLSIHDDSTYDEEFADDLVKTGTYFKVEKISHKKNYADAFEIDIGFGNTGTIVTAFSVEDNENYSLLYDFSNKLEVDQYVQRIDNNGQWINVWAPSITSKNADFVTRASDITWWTKITKYPIKATITVQGLLRPAMLLSYVRLNVIFPGGHKHISSGLYIVTQQKDTIDGNGYRTTLSLSKIAGDAYPVIGVMDDKVE